MLIQPTSAQWSEPLTTAGGSGSPPAAGTTDAIHQSTTQWMEPIASASEGGSPASPSATDGIVKRGAQWEEPKAITVSVALYGWEEDVDGWFVPVTEGDPVVETVAGFMASSLDAVGDLIQTRYIVATNTIQLR